MSDTFIAEYARNAARQRAQTATTVASGTDPNRMARAQRDARILGMSPEAVYTDPSFDREAQQVRNNATLATAPKTAAFLANDENAAVAHDQVESLSLMERTSEALNFGFNALAWQQRSQTLGLGALARRLPGAAGAGVLRQSAGFVAMTEASDDVLDMLDPILAYERLTGRAGIATQAQANRRQGSRQFREDITASAGRFNPATGNYVADAALQGVESVVPSLTGMALAALTGGTAAPVVASAFLAAPQGGTSYAEARDAGRGVGQSLVYGVAQGTTEYAGERLLGAGKLVERLALGQPILRSILRNQLEEQIGEQATTVLQDLNQWATINPDKPFSDYLKARPNAALQTAIATAVGTAVTGGVVGAVTAPIREGVTQEARATDAVVDAKAFSDLEAQVAGSELMTRAPDALRGALDQMLDGKTVFVLGEKVVEFFQSNPDLDQWLDEWDIRDQVEQAAAAGTDVAFSQGDYLVRVAPTAAGAAFKPDLRFAIGAMSEREAADRSKAQQDGETDPVLALLDESIARAQEVNDAAEPVARVQADVFGKLRAAGATVDVAREQATAVAARSEARAARRGDRFPDAWAAYQANPLDISQALPESVRQNMGRTDVFLRALRENRASPTQRRMLGRSLNEYLSANGGVYDVGGDLASMGLDQWHRGRPGVRKLLSDNNGSNGLDYALTRAIEGGYLRADATVDDLTAAMGEELRGRPTYSQGFERDLAGEENAAALNDFEQVLNTMGVDLSKETDAEVKAKLDKLANAVDGGETLNQSKAVTQTETPEFKAWFGESKVVDADGQPLRVYHGTAADFDAFDTSGAMSNGGQGAYFSSDPNIARAYAGRATQGSAGEGGRTVPVYLSIQNPFVIPAGSRSFADRIRAAIDKKFRREIERKEWSEAGKQSAYVSKERIALLEAEGYDGIINDGVNEIIAFRPEQIKSAIGNRGTFDATDPRILYQSSGESLNDILAAADDQGIKLSVSEPRDRLSVLSMIDTRGASQGEGAGSALMERLGAWADREGVRIALTPEKVGNTSKARLVAFYKRFGFSDNKGRSRDFSTREAMLREPQASAAEDAYIASINPSGTRLEESDRPNLGMGDMYGMAPKGARQIKIKSVEGLGRVRFVESNGDIYALAANPDLGGEEDVVGYMMARGDNTTELAVVNEAQGKGIGGDLSYEFRSRNPNAQSGGLTAAGEASARSAYRRMQGAVLNQNTGAPRGSISFTGNRQIITLMATADKSTFLHESGHAFLQELDEDAKFSGASQQLIDDHNAVFEWFERNADKLAAYATNQGGETITAENVTVWAAKRSMSAETPADAAIYTAAHEQWAETFEHYLMTGKAPSIRLRGSFERFSLWLKAIYNGITRSLPNAVITDDIRGVMDRLLATDEEIAAARSTMGLTQELETMRGLMTPQAFEAFADAVQRAADTSHDDLLAQTMKAVRREKTAEWNALAAEIRPDVEAEVDAMPDVAAIRFLRENGQGLSREFVVAMLGNEAGLALLPKGVPPLVRENGLHPDIVAEAAGYPSGVAMLNGLMDMQAEKVAAKSRGIDGSVRSTRINDRIRETLLDRYGDILNDGTIAEEALAALHNEKQGEVNQIALTVLGRRVGQSPSPLSVLRAWARRHIGERPISAARPDRFLQAERKAANAAAQAIAKDDRSEAYKQKQAQQANYVLYAAARQAREDVDKAVTRMLNLGRKRTIGSMDQDYLDQIHALLSQYDLRPASAREVAARQSLIDFVAEQEAAGRAVMVPTRLQAQAEKKHYSTLTVDQIRELDEAVSNLVQLGKLKQTLKDGKERREKELIFQEAEDTANGNLKSKPRKDGFASEEQLTSKMKASPQSFEASMVRIQEYFRRLQNGFDGVFTRMLDTPGQEAYERLSDLRASFWSPIRVAEKAIPDGVRARWFERLSNHPIINPETNQPFDSLIRQDLIGMAQHVGSVSNFEAFAKGWGVIPRNADEFAVEAGRQDFIRWLGTEMNEVEWDYVQAWWDAREQQREAYFENEREMTGIRPTPVEAALFEVNGRKFSGGYATIVHDTRYDKLARDRDAQDMADPFGGVTRRAKTSNGSANDRTGYVGPVDFRMKIAASSAHTQMVRIAYGQYIESAVEFLENDKVRAAIIDKLGRQAHINMQEWLSDQVKDHGMPELANREADSFMRSARSNVAIGSMLWSFTTLLSQVAGIAQSIGGVGIGTFAKGQALSSAMVARSGDPLAAVKFILSKSKYMNSRLNEGGLDASVRAAALASEESFNPKLVVARGVSAKNRLKHLINVERSAKNNVAVVGSSLIGLVDLVGASGPLWIGVYDNALVQGMDEEAAVRVANNEVVRAQGGSRPIDRSPLMRSKGMLQNLTMFFGWANAMYNVQRGAILDLRDGKNIMLSVQAIGATMILGPLMNAMLGGDAPWDDDEEGLFAWFFRNVLFGLGDSTVGVRDLTNIAERKLQGKYAGDPYGTVLQRLYGTNKVLADDLYAAAISDDDKEVSKRWPSHVISGIGYGLGWGGTAQASKTASYAVDVAEGDQEPANILDWISGVLRGPEDRQKK